MRITASICVGVLSLVGLSLSADVQAMDYERARVIRGGPDQPTPSQGVREVRVHPRATGGRIIRREVSEEAATVSRRLAEQPVHPHLAELRVGNQRVMVDPQEPYLQGHSRIDRNHSLIRAQQMYKDQQARPARVIRNEHAARQQQRTAPPMPVMEIYAPSLPSEPMERHMPEYEAVEPALPEVDDVMPGPRGPIPNVPEPAKPESGPLMVGLD